VASEPRVNAAARGAQALNFKHDADLPISARREAIVEALRLNQVLIVAGDTGSGKSTQLPQFCLELGRGIDALIAHTQPRRLAARALAARIAEEVGQPVGRSIGFRVRFADQVSDVTRLVLMTDGLLLAELASDPQLRRYDTIIVDEAHERTLNVDLLMGVLKRLLPRRPDLKVIVTSATLDVERISRFFDGAPIITVSGRAHPIEVRYTEMSDDAEELDLPAAVLEAFQGISTEPGKIGSGDVLVFLPGEREIRDVGEFLQRELKANVEILELYSRLSWEQQSKIFQRGNRQRIVLATNVAETSITVPGIRAVIDSGLARISRYSPRSRLQRLPIEPIARAGADQRKGRCGRLGPGLCVRLFTQKDFDERAAFTEPEILRTNLAALLLRLAADGLGDAESFPFIDPPDSRSLSDGYRLLQELQALDADRRITRRGRAMARLPLDPRLARALLESQRFHAEGELLAITAGLSVPDVRIAATAGAAGGGGPGRGSGAAAEPDLSAAFEDHKSEFSSLLKLWKAYRKAREGPRRELRRWCKERRFSLLRLSEWDDIRGYTVHYSPAFAPWWAREARTAPM
jgi:ATP-dependent helicase HrpA